MKSKMLTAVGALTLAIGLAPTTAALASPAHHHGLRDGAVFVQLNGAGGNSIEAFSRAPDGSLTPVGTYSTGGKGSKQVGAPVDALASQGSLVTTADHRVLVAVNAGSDTVSTLRVKDDGLQLASVVPSRGDFPSSVTVRGSLVYVLNAGGRGTVSGYRLDDGRLRPIPGAVRGLGLSNDPVPAFLMSPAQVGISPDGRTLVVTTKANNTIVTFPVRRDGSLGRAIVTPSTGPVPFSFVFDSHGDLQVQQAGDGRNVSYAVAADSTLAPLGSSDPSGGDALCWSVRVGRYLFGANAASGTLTSWRIARDSTTAVVRPVAASLTPGVIDLATSHDSRYLYALNGVSGTVDVLAVGHHGALVPTSQVSGLPLLDETGGPEGIVAD